MAWVAVYNLGKPIDESTLRRVSKNAEKVVATR